MRKKFTKSGTAQKIRKKPDPITVMTKDMRKVHSDFYGNMERLESEWNLCCDQYETAKEQSLAKNATFDARAAIRKISNYWSARRMALERALEAKDLESFRKRRNEQKENGEGGKIPSPGAEAQA